MDYILLKTIIPAFHSCIIPFSVKFENQKEPAYYQ